MWKKIGNLPIEPRFWSQGKWFIKSHVTAFWDLPEITLCRQNKQNSHVHASYLEPIRILIAVHCWKLVFFRKKFRCTLSRKMFTSTSKQFLLKQPSNVWVRSHRSLYHATRERSNFGYLSLWDYAFMGFMRAEQAFFGESTTYTVSSVN